MIKNKYLFSSIIIAYYNLNYLKKSINSFLNQSYKNIELIIVNNGAEESIKKYINNLSKKDQRVKLINLKKNFFDINDPELMHEVLLNKALEIVQGDFVHFCSYDDKYSNDYVQRMINLFNENESCNTAIGRCVSIDAEDNVNNIELNNFSYDRPRHMNGKDFALEFIKKNQKIHANPGNFFTFKTKILKDMGGFNKSFDNKSIFGIIPFSITGYDKNAIFYWRRHANQLNKTVTNLGITGAKDTLEFIENFNLYSKWLHFGKNNAELILKSILNNQFRSSANIASRNLMDLNYKGFINVILETKLHYLFLKYLFYFLYFYKKRILYNFLSSIKKKLNELYNYKFEK